MREKIKIAPRAKYEGKGGSVEISASELTFTLDDAAIAKAVAEAEVEAVRAGIRAVPGDKWHKTGTLAAGLRVERDGDSAVVVAPPGRLERDPKLREKLIADVAALRDPLKEPTVQKAIDELEIVKVTR